jgi:hypothetical protein
MSKDSEGNYYSPLSSFWEGGYKAENTWTGEVGLEKLDPEYSEEDVLVDAEPALILSPIC